jgi:hypothetical protein
MTASDRAGTDPPGSESEAILGRVECVLGHFTASAKLLRAEHRRPGNPRPATSRTVSSAATEAPFPTERSDAETGDARSRVR